MRYAGKQGEHAVMILSASQSVGNVHCSISINHYVTYQGVFEISALFLYCGSVHVVHRRPLLRESRYRLPLNILIGIAIASKLLTPSKTKDKGCTKVHSKFHGLSSFQ